MNGNGLRWMPLCISASASALLAAIAGSQASASETHKLKHGETVAAVARRFHVSVHAIAVANPGIDVNCVPDGHKLRIPEVSRIHHAVSSGHKIAYTRGDNVGLRLGPGETFRRVAHCDKGQKLVVSAQKDGWAHVNTADGRSGWMRHDFLKYAHGGVSITKVAAHHKKTRVEAIAAKHRAHAKHMALLAKHAGKKHSVKIAAAGHRAHSVHQTAPHHHAAYARSRENGRSLHHNSDGSVVGTAIAYRGTPYRYGSTGGGSFDCSGFTRFVYGSRGVSLPHSAKEQFHQGHGVSRGDMKPGDLVFFHTVTSGISHVGIYAGNGKFVHASSRRSGGVRVDRLDSGYYSGAFRGARRVK